MIPTLNLSTVTEQAKTLLGAILTTWRLVFRCGCAVSGVQHGGTFLANDHQPCWTHGADREPWPTGLLVIGDTFPTAAEHVSWRTGFHAGYRTAMGWTRTELRPRCDVRSETVLVDA